MKRLLLACMLGGAIFSVAPLEITAQTNAPAGAAPEARRQQAAEMRRGNIEARLQQLTERLQLTKEQQAKVRAILEQERQQLIAVRTNTALTVEERRTQLQQIRTQTQARIREVLTPEQAQKFDQIPAGFTRPPQVGVGSDTNRPPRRIERPGEEGGPGQAVGRQQGRADREGDSNRAPRRIGPQRGEGGGRGPAAR